MGRVSFCFLNAHIYIYIHRNSQGIAIRNTKLTRDSIRQRRTPLSARLGPSMQSRRAPKTEAAADARSQITILASRLSLCQAHECWSQLRDPHNFLGETKTSADIHLANSQRAHAQTQTLTPNSNPWILGCGRKYTLGAAQSHVNIVHSIHKMPLRHHQQLQIPDNIRNIAYMYIYLTTRVV